MISDFVYDLCHEHETVSTRLAANSKEVPGDVAKQLFAKAKSLPKSDTELKAEYDLQRAFDCGKWGTSRPSDLFLKVRTDKFE